MKSQTNIDCNCAAHSLKKGGISMKMSVELFDNIINTSQDCVFWKDKDRRFLGVNQAFLDFYGFESANVLVGKTDEDMGWHSDPEPYKQDELRVLSGESTYKVPGKCVIRGEERDIIASKRPLYEGDRIVGLVGSFVDVTDVLRRKNRLDGLQVVYTIDKLRRFPYFDRLLDETGLDEVLDPLTGIVSRVYAMDFVHSLISCAVPFTFTIVDLDNFKFINDSFGHSGGDVVLKTVTKGLAEFLGENGIVGRFGGDELLMIDLCHVDDASKQSFFTELYEGHAALRKRVCLETGNTFVTGTSGCASFPKDADNFAELFGLIDKALYLGKSRGRNCYVIYREDEHRDLEIKKLVKHNICSDMINLRKLFDRDDTLRERLKSTISYLTDSLQIADLYFVNGDDRMKAVLDEALDVDVSGIRKLTQEAIYAASSISDMEKDCPLLYAALKARGIESVMVVRVGNDAVTDGYLVCGVQRRFRIWQENECAIMCFLSTLVSGHLGIAAENQN